MREEEKKEKKVMEKDARALKGFFKSTIIKEQNIHIF